MTPDQLRAATGCTLDRAELYAEHLTAACAHYRIDTPQRLAAFLGQIGHESGGLRYVRELAAGDAYEGREDLGNTQPGDGRRYRGRGLIQITGRDNYRATARRLQPVDAPDFEDFPEALQEPRWACWSAADWWHAHRCNELADAGDIVALGRLINRGNARSTRAANGEADRIQRTEQARRALAAQPIMPADQGGAIPPAGPGDTRATLPAPSPESAMPLPAVVAALLPSIIEAIPKLGKVFGSGSAVSERNIKAAELVVDAVTKATGAVNAQEAVEKIAADPAVREVAAKAIDGIWYELTEAGGGGIDGARKAEMARNPSGDLLHSASFWVGLLLLPLVYLLVLSLIGMIGTATWSDDVRAGLAGSLISAIIGGLVGYYYGTSTSRNRPQA